MQRPRSSPTLFWSCWSNTLLWNVRMSPVLSPFLPTSTVVSVSACSMTWIVLVDRSVELAAELPLHPQAKPTVSTMAPTATQTLIPLVLYLPLSLCDRNTSPSSRPRPPSSPLVDMRSPLYRSPLQVRLPSTVTVIAMLSNLQERFKPLLRICIRGLYSPTRRAR